MAVSLNTALGAFPITALAGTSYVPLAGGTMTGALTLPAGTVSAPSLLFTGSAATTGIYSPAPNTVAISILGTRRLYMDDVGGVVFTNTSFTSGGLFTTAGNIRIADASTLGWSSTVDPTATQDVILRRDAAATLAQRNGTTQQIFRLYNTTDAGLTNYERLTLTGVAGTSVNITAETLGTGGDNLDIVLTPAGTGKVRLPDGLSTQLALAFTTTATTGIFAAVSGTRFGIVSNGTFSLNIASNFVAMPTASVLGWTSVGGADGSSIAAGLAYNAAGVVEVNNGTAGAYRDLKLRNLIAGGGNGSYVQTPSMTVASLAAAATAGAGARAFVTDATATTFLSTVAGGGSNKVPVVSDGTNWLIG